MPLELLDLDVDGETYEARRTVQDDDADVGVLVIPGAGHGPFGDIFDIVGYELAGDGKQVLAYETWETGEELDAKTLAELHREVDAALDLLAAHGCTEFHVLAKSFGGGVALSRVPDRVESMVLWAPALDVGVDPGDATDPTEELGSGDSVLVSLADLDHVDVPVFVLRGEHDQGVSLADCEDVVDRVGAGEVTEIPGENHSFNENRTAVVEQTLAFLS